MWRFLHSLKAALRFHDYQPQHVTVASATRWMKQIDKKDLKLAWKLLDKVIYLSEAETKKILVHQNSVLMSNLHKAGLPPKKLIYVQTDDAGSSSPMMLGILRNAAGLEQLGCTLLDGRDAFGINEATKRLEEGAIIYIDDFVGSGIQLNKARTFLMQSVVGSFSEFLIVPSICEEGLSKLTDLGVTVYTGHIHAKAERPLHESSHSWAGTDAIGLLKSARRSEPRALWGSRTWQRWWCSTETRRTASRPYCAVATSKTRSMGYSRDSRICL